MINPRTKREEAAYDRAFESALAKAGSIERLARALTRGDRYISHNGIRTWRLNRSIPVRWALYMEEYDNEANFFDLVPWMLPRAVRYKQVSE